MKKFIIFSVAVIVVGLILGKLFWPKTTSKTEPQITAATYDIRPDKIDIYFYNHAMPLNGYGIWFVGCADTNKIDWNLLAAISVIESQGGKHYPSATNNPFGWNSAKSGFPDITTGLCFISEKLGNGKFYAGKTLRGKLQAYNPPSVNPTYADSVIKIMKDIESTEVPADYNLPIQNKNK